MPKLHRQLTSALLWFIWPAAMFAQSPSSSQQSPPPNPPPSQSQPQTETPPKQASVAEAAKKNAADKPKPKKVYTEDDFSGMKKGSVSVVGNDNKKPRRARPADSDPDYNPNGEEYWRSRSQPILDEIAATDQQIAQIQEEIKKSGSVGFDLQTGRKDNVAYIHDRNAQIQELQKHKVALQKELEDLEEEGRKAGAPPAWFR